MPGMLVLSRNKDEEIIINDNIIVKVIDVRGNKVRLGIDAPKNISVHRREVWEDIKQKGPRKHVGMPPLGHVSEDKTAK